MRVYQAGTYRLGTWTSNSLTATGTGVPNPPSVASLTGDFRVDAIAAWHVTTAGTTATTPPTNYVDEMENAAGSHVTHLSVTTRALTALSNATEDPGAFGDNVTPNGTVAMTIAIPGAVEFTRAASIDGGATLDTSAEFLSILERSTALDGQASIDSSGEVVAPLTEHERSASVAAVAAIESSGSGFSIFERSAAVSATGGLSSSGTFLTEFSRTVSLGGSASLSISYLRDVLRSASIGSIASISSVPQRELLRSSAATAVGTISSAGGVSQVHEASASMGALAAVSVAGQSWSILSRSAAIVAVADVTIDAYLREHVRSSSLSASATLVVGPPAAAQAKFLDLRRSRRSGRGRGQLLVRPGDAT